MRFAVVVPDESQLTFESNAGDAPVFRLSDAVQYCNPRSRESGGGVSAIAAELRSSWTRYRDREDGGDRRSARFLGRFQIRKGLDTTPGSFTYAAFDEPPCKVDVHLKEYRFDPTATADQILKYLEDVSRELRVLRRIRHPYVVSAVGHFQTGSSWVQVSDWFDGQPLEHRWDGVRELSVHDKIGLCSKMTEALAFCHQKGIFHRDISAENVLVSPDFDDLRVTGFELAKDIRLTSTLGANALTVRDPRLITPEELATGSPPNPRLADTFQLGLLFYRIFQGGDWPYGDPMDFYTSGGAAKIWPNNPENSAPQAIANLLLSMLSLVPSRRPDPLSRVGASLAEISMSVS